MDNRALSIWMPLQTATPNKGCMQFVGGSHLLDVQDHHLVDPDSDGVVVSDLATVGKLWPVRCFAGGATIHANRTLHDAGRNLTDGPRRALIMASAARRNPVRSPGRSDGSARSGTTDGYQRGIPSA